MIAAMINRLKSLILTPQPRYPEAWGPAYTALQLGFLAGAGGYLGRVLLFVWFVEEWPLAVAVETAFASIVGIGFILHTAGWASAGVILSCLSGVGAASVFLFLFGWDSFFHLWLINLAVLLIAVPIRRYLQIGLSVSFVVLYCVLFVYLDARPPLWETPQLFIYILGISNIVGSLLILGLPMGMYALELAKEREKSERLLHNILPKEIADVLKETDDLIAMDNPEISVLFADIVNFTPMAESKSADELVSLLNGMFSRFDDLCEKHGAEKIKTIGDSYMVVAGAPEPRPDHAKVLAKIAVEMLAVAGEYRDHHDEPIQLRIGLHSGPAISGVIGKSKFAFDLWGDTINTAARMESHGRPGRVRVSRSTYELLKNELAFCKPEVVEVKGKGNLETYLLEDAVPGK